MENKSPTIAVLSGKGGTGKTFVAVNLAAAADQAHYLDCDVEEPNGHLFLQPQAVQEKPVAVLIPRVDQGLCTGCRFCVEFCKFNALALVMDQLLVFEEMCHSCGGCVLVCPEGALTEREKIIGSLRQGKSGGVHVYTGIMNIGEISGVPIIESLLHVSKDPRLPTIIDCPPGAACSVMESIKGADYCLIVVEPTLFGLHNFRMVHELTRFLGKPAAVVANKWLGEYTPVERYCLEAGIPILAKIPYDHDLALLNSKGKVAVRESPPYQKLFRNLLERVLEEAGHETALDS